MKQDTLLKNLAKDLLYQPCSKRQCNKSFSFINAQMDPFSFKELGNLILIVSIQLLFLVALGFHEWLAFQGIVKLAEERELTEVGFWVY